MICGLNLGGYMWTKKLDGINDDAGYAVRQTSDGGYVVCGPISSRLLGTEEVFIMRLAPEMYPAENEEQYDEEHSFGPAIVRGPLMVPGTNNCELLDISGRKVEVENMIPDVYYILEHGKVVQKIMRMR